MHYEIYIDVVFFTNLLIDYILIRFTGILFRCGRSRKRALLGAAAGAVFSCWIIYLQSFLESGIFLPALVLLHGGCAAGMLVIGCNLKRGSLLLKAILTLYFAAFLCGGFWEVIVSDKLTVKMFLIDPCSSNVVRHYSVVISDGFHENTDKEYLSDNHIL